MFYKKRIVGLGALSTLGVIASLGACSTGSDQPSASSQGAVESAPVKLAAARLKAAHPKATVHVQGDRIRRIYGVSATGPSPDVAAETFRRSSAPALGVDPADLAPARLQGAAAPNANGVGLMYNPATGKYKFRLYSYEQQRDGIPVFRGGLRTLVREDDNNRLVWANTDLRPVGSFRAHAGLPLRSVDLERSLQAARASLGGAGQSIPMPTTLAKVSTPTHTIFAGTGAQATAPRLAMQYTAQDANGPGRWTFVADAATGDILHVESNIHFAINGTVKGEVITGPESMECGTRGEAPLPYANVTSTAGNATADAAGAFTITQSGTTAVTVTSNVTGRYFAVKDAENNSHSISLRVTPPGPANFVHRDTQVPPERVLAQLNAYKAANDIRDMLLRYVPDYPVIAAETNFQINVNLTDRLCDLTGGAWYYDDSLPRTLNFCLRTSERTNTAFRSLVHHEYGHHIVDSARSGQAAYGEGMSDTVALLFSKDSRIGIGYHPNSCEPLRNAATNCQYLEEGCSSCGSDLYQCGAVLSGIVWDIWKELDVTEPGQSDDIIRSLVLSSVLLHTGTSIDESLVIDLLTLDDDDEMLENGTPHYAEICAGFNKHGMNCPAIADGLVVKGSDLNFGGPSHGPFEPSSVSYTLHNLGPQQSLTYSVRTPADAQWLSVDSTGGTIALGQRATVTLSVNQAQAALLPDGKYSALVEFVNQTSGVGSVSRTAKLRVGAPVPIYTATFGQDLEGFTLDAETDNAWHRSAACVDNLPGHTSSGFLYYGKDSVCNYAVATPNRHTITSPVIQIANPQTAELAFNYYLATEASSDRDRAEVLISANGGPFEVVASNNNGGDKLNETNGWKALRLDISGRLPATGPTRIQVQLAFYGLTIDSNTRTGFAIDDIIVYAQPAAGCTSCSDQGPCAGYCTNPIKFSTKGYQSGNLGGNATCHETTAALSSGNCGNFVSPRKLFVNGVEMPCDWAGWQSLPAPKNGGYCIYTTSGNQPWAAFSTW